MVLLVPKKENISYTRLIEEQAHFYLPISQVKFSRYINAKDICFQLTLSEEELLDYVNKSELVHGVFCESGAFFVHPDGFKRYIRDWAKKVLKAKKPTAPFTCRAISLC